MIDQAELHIQTFLSLTPEPSEDDYHDGFEVGKYTLHFATRAGFNYLSLYDVAAYLKISYFLLAGRVLGDPIYFPSTTRIDSVDEDSQELAMEVTKLKCLLHVISLDCQLEQVALKPHKSTSKRLAKLRDLI